MVGRRKEVVRRGLVTLAGLVKLHFVGQKNRGPIGAQKAYTSPICPQPVLLCVGFFFLNPAEDPYLVSACWVWHHVMIYCHLITVH
jgi:hypothetical protein